MKKVIMFSLIALLLLSFFGCAQNAAADKMIVKYDLELSMVRKPSDISQRYRAPVADTTQAGIVRYAFEDDLFRSIWSATEAGWDVVLYNKSEMPIMIDWDNASYMDYDNIGHGVNISSTKPAERNNPQTPTVIPRRGNITEKLYSNDHVYQSSVTGSWIRRPLLPIDYNDAVRYKGKELRLIVPFTVDGLTAQYEFVFSVKDVRQVKATSDPWSGFLMDWALGSFF